MGVDVILHPAVSNKPTVADLLFAFYAADTGCYFRFSPESIQIVRDAPSVGDAQRQRAAQTPWESLSPYYGNCTVCWLLSCIHNEHS